MQTDFLVIGSGAAGLSFALKAAEHGRVTVVTKGELDECNTNYAQGGICSVTYAPDTFEKHIRDTLVCGAGKCDPAAVELVVRRAPELIRDLIAWGTRFDKTPDGRFELNREGGHSEHRILHYEDLTGAEIERALVASVRRHPNITLLERHYAVDLLTQHHLGEFVTRHTRGVTCFGAYVLDLTTNAIETVLAKFTVVAAGGCGNVYSTTTNPVVATGDGIAMCHRAKAITENMEYIQFHPTSLYNPGERPSFLITEAMRGFGAILRLQNGEEFMDKYHPMKSLAPRDVVARSIYREMQLHGQEFVYLDVTHKPADAIRSHFPNIYEKCLSIGIDITKDWIPVTPAAHYCCGGVKVSTDGETSIRRLYALGETSCTGLHGANRLGAHRGGGLRRPGGAPCRGAAGSGHDPGGYSRLEFRGNGHGRGDAARDPVEARVAADHVQLRGHHPFESLPQTRHAPSGNALARDGGALRQDDAQPRVVRTAQHDYGRLPYYQAGARVEGVGRLPLQYGLSARDGGRVKRAADAGAVSRKDGSRNRNS